MAYNISVKQGEMKRQEILEVIKDYILEHQYPPTVREIGRMVGLKSNSSVHHHLQCLIEEGRLESDQEYGESRAIRLPGYKFVKDGKYTERELQLADFIMNNFRFCPIPTDIVCEHGFRKQGCKDCLLSHAHLLSKPRED